MVATPKCRLCMRMNVNCTYVRRFVTPSLLRRKQNDRDREIDASLSNSLQQRVNELENTVRILMKELLSARTGSNAMSIHDLAMTPASVFGPLPVVTPRSDAFISEQALLDLALPNNSNINNNNINNNISMNNMNINRHLMSPVSPNPPPLSPNVGVPVNALASGLNALSVGTVVQDQNSSESDLTPLETEQFESDDDRDALLKTFFEMDGRYILQIVHPGCFWKRLRSPNPPAEALILTMCSIAASAVRSPDGSLWPCDIFLEPGRHPRSERFLNAAVLALDVSTPTVDACLAVLLMILIQSTMPEPQTSRRWLLGGMAMRMVRSLQLDVDPDVLEATRGEGWTWVERETRRRVFAVVCMLDEVDMLLRERCLGIWKRKDDVRPPAPQALWRSVNPETGEPTFDSTAATTDVHILTLSILNLRCRITELNRTTDPDETLFTHSIEVKAVQHVGVPPDRAPTKLEITPELQFALLDAELGIWYQSLPARFQPKALANDLQFTCLYDNVATPSIPPFAALKLNLFHHFGCLSLHRPRVVRELKALAFRNPLEPVVLSEELKLSLRRAAEACVGVTQLLKRKVIVLPPSPRPQRLKPFATYLTWSSLLPLLEVGVMNAVFLVALGLGHVSEDDADPRVMTPEQRSEVARLIADVIGDTFKIAAIEGVSLVMQLLRGGVGGNRKRVSIVGGALERVVAMLSLEGYVQPVSDIELADPTDIRCFCPGSEEVV
ncbi:hypothetical protein HK101_008543 [Irineochytrium annulatum]|nr:hypothetical protein HK101_008543 [Irineochytrium annulatum]